MLCQSCLSFLFQEESSAQDAACVCVPSTISGTNQETERDQEQKRWRSADTERHGDSQMQRGKYPQRDSGLSSTNRTVAPSSGKSRSDIALCTDAERERKVELKGWRDRERVRESETPRERQKENKRSKEKMREDARGRYWGNEMEHGSTVSDQSRNYSSTAPSSSSTETNYFHPSGKVSGSERKERSSTSRADDVSDRNEYKVHRDTSVDSKDGNVPHDQHSRQVPSRSYQSKVDKVMRESEREVEAERVGEAYKPAVESKRQVRRELEEGERSSSRSSNSSSSASLEYKEDDDRRKGRKKHKKHRQEKRRAAPELLEDVELKKHKESKKESGGEVDDRVKEQEQDHARLFSAMLS